eukprot:TRINITY_DN3009_c0_g1_i1.p1 TRINITY_DN3009_c0_g1~~TRINITY_DN3009_c0_g1_i1.p1  ORF type:complete len:826 (+),score=179.31 TRINITY_DN3009_c0_g1_i1:96-2573(+)
MMKEVPPPPLPQQSRPLKRNPQGGSGDLLQTTFCGGYANPNETEAELPFDEHPENVLDDPEVPYFQLGAEPVTAELLLARTPLPKGASAFTSVHIVAGSAFARGTVRRLAEEFRTLKKQAHVYEWPALDSGDAAGEFNALFDLASKMILAGADRASLLIYLASPAEEGDCEMATAVLLGMIPFRGVQMAFVTQQARYIDPLSTLSTKSGLYEYGALGPERMGRKPLAAIFGPLPARTFRQQIDSWCPLRPLCTAEEKPAPFKIGGLDLPMVTFEGAYAGGISRLTRLLVEFFADDCNCVYPIVAVGETGDQLGYGWDLHAALGKLGHAGYYFVHSSGESFKRPDAYGRPELLKAMLSAKREGKRVVIIAVGGGVNGNAVGMLAALTGSDFVEVPTTLMHYNDATTSAKKAFSLVVNDKILSKNILGAFYLPKLVYCISEVFLTLSPCSIYAAAGEAAKTMSMLGRASTLQGRTDFHNILGAGEFASDFTRVAASAPGFERLIAFIKRTGTLKQAACDAGRRLRELREACDPMAADAARERDSLLKTLREGFYDLPFDSQQEIMAFLTTINEEVIKAKAMFLAYSDPFEKYRALLFEYAHTLGHGVEAFMNGLYRRAEAAGLDYADAFRLHGQCVGMAVVWAGEMSRELGYLNGDGFLAHQALVGLFNRSGGFDFAPLRRLCDSLGVSCEEFCEGVLQVVRRDNKRGYCKCADGSSVDQLVQGRPGCLVRSSDPSAELRYLVEVSEDSQRAVLSRAFQGEFDQAVVASASGYLTITPRSEIVSGADEEAEELAAVEIRRAAEALDVLMRRLYAEGDYCQQNAQDIF